MAAVSTLCRRTTQLARQCSRTARISGREMSTSPPLRAASNFVMPAMSPTMTEGNLAKWMVKEGDSFTTGDVLLEIETDKAQMDVEAQDDGVMAKIIEQDGTKGIKVGTRIAVLAEPGDDLSTLEMPAEEHAESPKESKPSATPREGSASKSSTTSTSPPSPSTKSSSESSKSSPPSSGSKASTDSPSDPPSSSSPKSKYPPYPSVQHLLHTNGVSAADAAKITATGPGGRLLKGDVLAHLGLIAAAYSAEQSERIAKMGHLDLSNVKAAKPAAKPPSAAETKEQKRAAEAPRPVDVALPISLAAVLATQERIRQALGIDMPVATFIARASEMANEGLPRARGERASSGELFDAVVGPRAARQGPARTRGHYVPRVASLPPPPPPAAASRSQGAPRRGLDIIDVLAGRRAPAGLRAAPAGPRALPGGVAGAENVFAVRAKPGEERRARVYLERVKSVLESEPGRCVL